MGKREDFERAVAGERGALLRRARYKLCESDAEDAVQEALLVALGKTDWESIQSVAGWLSGVIDKVVWGVIRKRREGVDIDCDDLAVVSEDVVDRMIVDEELAREIGAVLELADQAGLSRKEHYVVCARLRGREYREIGAALGIEANAARSYYSLAVGKMRGIR